MSLTITPQINGQQANGTLSYCFLNEPLKVHVQDNQTQATGYITFTAGAVAFQGVSTLFLSELTVGDIVLIQGVRKKIAFIYNNTNAAVDNAFSADGTNEQMFIGLSQFNQINADVTQIDTYSGTEQTTKAKYIVKDFIDSQGIVIDLMKVVKQLHDFDTYHIQSIADLVTTKGKNTVLSKYIYKFEFYVDSPATKTTILKLPILGGRTFDKFVPAVDHTTAIRETDDFTESNIKTFGLPRFILKTISSVSNSDYSLDYDAAIPYTSGTEPCEGRIVWKSKLGSWMTWGMNLKTEQIKGSYDGQIDTGMFESTDFTGGGNPYIPVNYTSVSSSESVSLKVLDLTADQLKVVSGIHGSPAVYYQRTTSSKLELMKLKSASTPIKSLIHGGDFSVSLDSLNQYEHRVK